MSWVARAWSAGELALVGGHVCPAPQVGTLVSLSLQKSALIVQGPREVQKRELVFLQFRLNQSSEDFSAIDYLLFSSFQEFLQRCPSDPARPQGSHSSRVHRRAGGGGRCQESGTSGGRQADGGPLTESGEAGGVF